MIKSRIELHRPIAFLTHSPPPMNPHTAARILRNHNDWRRGLIEQSKYTPRAVIEIIETFAPDNEVLIAYADHIKGHGIFRYEAGHLGREIDSLIIRLLEE